jgi:hypothetical protein
MEKCRLCGNRRGNKAIGVLLYRCAKCGALYGTCYLGESYQHVLPFLTSNDVPATEWRYFDFTTLGSEGIEQRHGWFDPSTRHITQIG